MRNYNFGGGSLNTAEIHNGIQLIEPNGLGNISNNKTFWSKTDMSNLRLLNETTVTSAVSNVSITDVFTSDFDIYKMTMVYDNSAGNVLKTQMIDKFKMEVLLLILIMNGLYYQMRSSGTFQQQKSAK